MREPSRQQPSAARENPADAVVALTARWLGVDDDVALGCECADPALQIDRWQQEVTVFEPSSS